MSSMVWPYGRYLDWSKLFLWLLDKDGKTVHCIWHTDVETSITAWAVVLNSITLLEKQLNRYRPFLGLVTTSNVFNHNQNAKNCNLDLNLWSRISVILFSWSTLVARLLSNKNVYIFCVRNHSENTFRISQILRIFFILVAKKKYVSSFIL